MLAQQALRDGGPSTVEKTDFILRRLLARPAWDQERPIIEQSLTRLLDDYRQHPDDARQLLSVGESPRDETLDATTLAAWTMLTNELMNLDEVLNK